MCFGCAGAGKAETGIFMQSFKKQFMQQRRKILSDKAVYGNTNKAIQNSQIVMLQSGNA